MQATQSDDMSLFQSRAGFSECLDVARDQSRLFRGSVSIPCWVF